MDGEWTGHRRGMDGEWMEHRRGMDRVWIGHRWCIDRAWESIKFNIMLNRLKSWVLFPPGMPILREEALTIVLASLEERPLNACKSAASPSAMCLPK